MIFGISPRPMTVAILVIPLAIVQMGRHKNTQEYYTFYTLDLTNCIMHLVSYTLHPTLCILHFLLSYRILYIVSYTLYLANCILHIAS